MLAVLGLILKLYFTIVCLIVVAFLFSKYIIRNEHIEDIVAEVGIYTFIIGMILAMFSLIIMIWW